MKTSGKSMIKPITLWAVYDKDGDIVLRSIAETKSICISDFRYGFGFHATWKELYQNGYRAVKVIINPMHKKALQFQTEKNYDERKNVGQD